MSRRSKATETEPQAAPWPAEGLPRHVAIIPDGNRRWARGKGLPVAFGHQRGVAVLEQVVSHALEHGIDYLSVWGASVNNVTKRSRLEVQALFHLFEDAAVRMLQRLQAGTRKPMEIRISGRWRELFPASTVRKLQEMIDGSARPGECVVQLLLGYDGREEMLQAVARLVAEGKPQPSAADLKAALWSAGMPPVDLVIRTGCEGDPHLSDGFMMWDVADAQLCFSETPWPDFGVEGMIAAVRAYQGRERRLGK